MTTNTPNPIHIDDTPCEGFVAWELLDGSTMAGHIVDPCNAYGFDRARVARVDGTQCDVPKSSLRPATVGEVQRACEFFTR